MKQVVAAYILPFTSAIAVVYGIAMNPHLNERLFGKKQSAFIAPTPLVYIENFADNPAYEDWFLRSNDSSETIFLLGSSELTGETEASPYNFITKHFTTKLNAVGHAGNQCFSIYSQLLANDNRLNNAPVVIILSPMWFQSDAADGTSAKIFLEFNSERFVNNIIENESADEFKDYESKRISELYTDFSSPDFALKQMHFQHEASRSILHRAVYAPLIKTDELLFRCKMNVTHPGYFFPRPHFRKAITQDSILINWDSLFAQSKKEMLDKTTNNAWGIGNDYYSEYIKGNTSTVKMRSDDRNKELQDFKMLIRLLKEKKANASFIILPMNPYYYTNLSELTPLVNSLEADLESNHFSYLNFWVTDTAKFEKGILKDVMHLSSYGWYTADKFITETYHLSK